MDTKKCTKCGEVKPLYEFGKRGSRHRAECKVCRNTELLALRKERYANAPKEGVKECTWCKTAKDFAKFSKGQDEFGLSSWCKECVANASLARKICRTPAQQKSIDEHQKNSRLRQRHARTGFTPEVFARAMVLQKGKCAICGSCLDGLGSKSIAADHCHVSHSPRGVLCKKCNLALGGFNDSVPQLKAAIAYLENPPLWSDLA